MNSFTLCAFADEAGASIQEQIKALNENRIPCLEIRGIGDKNITQLTVQQAKELKLLLDRSGITVWSIGSPLGKIPIEEDFPPHLDVFQHTLELAVAVGASCLRLFSFYIPDAENAGAYRDEVMERLSRMCACARGSGIRLCHENEKGIYGDIASRCADIHQQLPDLAAVFDPANFVQCGQDPLNAWKLLAPYVHYVHVKDALANGKIVPAGKGQGKLPEILPSYQAQGGTILTLEPHLAVFRGLDNLEQKEKSHVDDKAYPSQRAAFDAGAAALKSLLSGLPM